MDLEVLYEELRGMEVTNPACMDKIMSYKEDIELEADDYMHVLVESLSHAMITWEQPWYQEQDKLSLQPLIENRDGLPKFREDPITKDEGEHILNNWRKLVKKYNIPDKLQCFARWRNIGYNKRSSAQENVRRFIHSYLARGLNRTIPQVYRHIVNTYRRTKKGRYTPDEEKLMEICFYHYPPRAVRIASFVLDRGDKGITKRFLVSRNGKPEFNRIKWTLPLATKLVNLLVKYTGEESYDGLKNKPIHISIWRDVENHFDTLACYLRHFWYTSLHCQLFIKYDVTLRRVRRRVFKILRNSPYKVWTDIRWKDVVAQLPDGFTFQFIYHITIRILRHVRNHTKLPLQEVVKIGLRATNRKGYGNKRLKTLVMNKEGNLEAQRYSNKF